MTQTPQEILKSLEQSDDVKKWKEALNAYRTSFFGENSLVTFHPNDNQFVVEGKTFWIYPDSMSAERLIVFGELLPTVIYGRKYFEQVDTMHKLERMLTSGNDILKAQFNAAQELYNWNKMAVKGSNAKTFMEKYTEDVLLFCATFILEPTENPKEWNLIKQQEKVKLWKDHCDMTSFFLLAKLSAPMLKTVLPQLQQVIEERGDKIE